MKKTLLLLCALLAGVSGAWAINVKVIRSTKAPNTFGSLASTTFTTNSASGLAEVTIAGITTTKPTNFSYGACLGVESSSSGTITMTAPTGYYIYGYSLTARSNTSSVPYTLTPSAGGSAKTTSTGGVTLTASGLSSQTASFTYSASSANSFYIPSMTIIIIADGATVIDVTYTLYYGGVTRGTATIKQGVGEAAGIPEALDNGFMTYSYSPSTIATSSTTAVTATATWDGPFQIGDAFNTIPRWYRVRLNSNNNFYIYNNSETLSFNNGSFDKTSKDYLWGFVGNPYDGFQIYNYNLGSSKAIDMAVPCTLSADGTSSTFKIAQGKAGSTSSTADSYFALYDPTHSNYLNKQGDFIKRYSVDEGSTFLINAVKVVTFEDGNGDPCAVAVDGGSAVSTIYVATNGNDSFTLPDANLYSLDGGTSWKTNTEAVNAIKAAGTDDISVTVAPAITVTYYLKWNSSTIKTQASVKTPQGFSPSVTVPWNAPAFCDFSYDVSTIEESTTEVNVTIDWDGPFDFSADFASAKWYYMTVNGGYLIYDEVAPYGFCSKEDALGEGSNAIWAFIGDPYNGVRVINKTAGNGKYLNLSSTVQMAEGAYPTYSLCGITENSTSETIGFSLDNDGYYLCYYVPGEGDPYLWYGQGEAWAASSQGRITVEPYIVTYNLKFGGSTIATKTLDKVTGDSEDLLPGEWERDFCTYSYEPAEIGNSTTSVDVTMTWDGPFDISADYENAVWYYLAVNGKWGKNNASGFEYTPDFSSDIADVKGTDGGQWAFFGNPYDGFLLSLKEKYSNVVQVYLTSQLENPAFSPSNGSTEKWTVTRLSGTTFTLNCGDKYLVDNSTTMGFKTTALEGSEGTFSVRSYYCQQALDFIDDYANDHALGQYFGVSTESYNYLRNSFAEAESLSAEEYTSLESNISAWLSPKLPETGYYRIKSSGSRGDQSYITYGYLDGSKGTGLLTTIGNKETDLGTVVKLTRVGTSKNYKISIQGLNVQAHSGDNTLFRATGAEGPNFQFNHINLSGMCSIYDGTDDHGNMHEAGWKKQDTGLNGVVGWTAGDGTNASSWSIEDATTVTVPLNGPVSDTYYYATLYLPFDVTITNANAYTLAESNGWLIPTAVPSNQVPAGTPVLLKGTTGTATATINTGDSFGEPLECALTGVYVETEINGATDYVLGADTDNVIGFYHWEENTLSANRAYVDKTPTGVKGYLINWGDADGIQTIDNIQLTKDNAVIYNLAGQRLSKLQKGVNIVNGKKVLVK